MHAELFRKSVNFVVSGPDTGEEAVRHALEGYAATCAAIAIGKAEAAAALVASPEPVAHIAAATAALPAAFEVCIEGVSAAGVAGGIVRQLNIDIKTPGHWAPL